MRSSTDVIPGACGLAGFAVALLAGMSSDRPAASVLFGAIVAMIICRLLGTGVGVICHRLADEAVRQYKASNPVPDIRAAFRAASTPSEGAGS